MATSAGLRASSFESASELLSRFTANAAACAILDVTLPDACAFGLQERLARAGVSVMFVTRERCIASCVRAIRAGAVDFLTLPCEGVELVRALRFVARHAVTTWAQIERFRDLRSRYQRLTEREREVLALVTSGMLNKQIAERLEISAATVQIHRSRVMRKMRAGSLASLVRMADELQVCAERGPPAIGGITPHLSLIPFESLPVSFGEGERFAVWRKSIHEQCCIEG